MKRIHLKKKRKGFVQRIPKINIIILLIILLIATVIFSFRIISKKVSPTLLEYAELQAGKIATYIIRQAVSSEVTDKISVDDLFIISKDSNQNIKTLDFNPLEVNRLLSKITETVNDHLTSLETTEFKKIDLPSSISSTFASSKEGNGLVFEIPSGVIFKNTLLANLGPKIPVKLTLVGDIDSDIKTKITDYGINNAFIEISVYVHVVEQVILPISSKRVDVEMNVPIALKMIQGEIPDYYLNGIESKSSLSVPSK